LMPLFPRALPRAGFFKPFGLNTLSRLWLGLPAGGQAYVGVPPGLGRLEAPPRPGPSLKKAELIRCLIHPALLCINPLSPALFWVAPQGAST